MALAGTWAMYGVGINSREVVDRIAKNNQSRNQTTGMGIDSNWTKQIKSTAERNFMAWSLKIPLSEGYHEEFV